MKPKPFCPLNHFTVPVAIVSSPKSDARRFAHCPRHNSTDDVLGKRAARTIQQGTTANRIPPIYTLSRRKQGNAGAGPVLGQSRQGPDPLVPAGGTGSWHLSMTGQVSPLGHRRGERALSGHSA